MRVLIAPDKFKGTLTAQAAAKAIARGWRKIRPQDELELLPISDGGDGFGQVIGDLLDAKIQRVKTVNAAHQSWVARWWWDAKSKTAVMESASVIGLAMLPPGKFHPFDLDTFGLGAVIEAAVAKGAKRTIIGIGGSATNDGGFGMARALGWKFLRHTGDEIERWTDLHWLAEIRAPKKKLQLRNLIVAVDVQNPLLGARGATRVFGPQKGLREDEFAQAEVCLRRMAHVVETRRTRGIAQTPGAGAAGGLGFGLLAFANARLEFGFDLFARLSKLHQRLRSADLVTTGEGRLDRSTLMGKGVGQLAMRCREQNVPSIAIVGEALSLTRKAIFENVYAVLDVADSASAKSEARHWIERLATRAAERFAV